ncbi:rod-binding protein [Aquibium sp. A9E412]|uniref:rod-binding protein n=1 Tax=Aquibium sp. A9E412 TaxID=2976767 RepID=UPI0025B16A49|nr:rod-binding protein [Aquibium sp. A9E412]MDN2567262.1 rod-binding protein [Aquibium sp. A9E412]
MAISPPGDIVSEVAAAADPAALAAARAKLARHAERADGTGFAATTAAPAAAMPAAPRGAPAPDAFVKFEAMVLQTFVESMLPEDSDGVYGEGLSGEMWKSMLAGELARAMADRGGIGIAERVLGDHYMDGEEKVPLRGVSADPGKAEAETQDLLSVGLLHQIQRRAAEAIGPAAGDGATGATTREG